jgi:uncharacterized protein YhaN
LLPVFLDETLVNWDATRTAALIGLLAQLAGRQVLVATCHGELARSLAEAGAHAIEMPAAALALAAAD